MISSVQTTIQAAQGAKTRCANCMHFNEEQVDTGFCRFHKMYVLRSFDCPNFVLKILASIQGGDAGG